MGRWFTWATKWGRLACWPSRGTKFSSKTTARGRCSVCHSKVIFLPAAQPSCLKSAMWKELESSPVNARVAPFIIFLGLTWLQNHFGEAGRYWIYAAKTGVGAWMLWQLRGAIVEMRWAFRWAAVGG